MSKIAFSVSVGEESVRVAEVEKKEAGLSPSSLAITTVDTNFYRSETEKDLKETAAILQKLVSDAEIKTKNANLVIPDGHSYSRIVEMPALTEKELLSAIKYQADQFIPMPIDKVTLDVEVLKEDKKNKKIIVLLIAASNNIVEKIIKVAEIAGFIPSVVENETSANLRLISFLAGSIKAGNKKKQENSADLYINLGNSSTSIYLLDNLTETPLQIHNFSLGFHIFVKDIHANYNVAEEDAKQLLERVGFETESNSYNLTEILASPYREFISQIEKFIVSAKSKLNLSVGKILFFGEGFKIRGLEKKISSTLGIKTEIYNPYPYLEKNETIDHFKESLPLFISALGAAMD